jgi:tetratricopeptide (TPR) repeat protein
MSFAATLVFALSLFVAGDHDALRDGWREALELDAEARVVREAKQRFEQDQALARDGELLALYARALASTGSEARGRALLDAAEVSATTRFAVELELARFDLRADDLDAVVARLASADEQAPVRFAEHPEAWLLFGKALARRGDAQPSAKLLQHFVSTWRLHPEAPSAWHVLAQEALSRRDLETAKFCRTRGQELSTWHGFYKTRRLQVLADPTAPLPRLGLAQLWLSVEEHERARVVLVELVALNPEFARAWATLGETERKLGNERRAYDALGKALELDATLHDARMNRGLLALGLNESDTARSDFERLTSGSTANDPRYAGAHLQLARMLKQSGDEAGARLRYTKYRELGGKEEL